MKRINLPIARLESERRYDPYSPRRLVKAISSAQMRDLREVADLCRQSDDGIARYGSVARLESLNKLRLAGLIDNVWEREGDWYPIGYRMTAAGLDTVAVS
jgi:hypothetical protein